MRTRSSATKSVVCLLVAAFALTVTACSSDDDDDGKEKNPARTSASSGPTTESSARSRLGEVAAEMGCSETVADGKGSGWTLSEDCLLDGQPSANIHIFEAPDRERVKRSLSSRYGENDLGRCPDGSALATVWIVLGSDWVVVTTLEPVARDLEANLEGEVLDDGEPNGPPVSYEVDGLCPSTDE